MPTYTFFSTANAFILRFAKVVFVNSRKNHPRMDEELIENLVTENKSYCCSSLCWCCYDMDKVLNISRRHKLIVI